MSFIDYERYFDNDGNEYNVHTPDVAGYFKLDNGLIEKFIYPNFGYFMLPRVWFVNYGYIYSLENHPLNKKIIEISVPKLTEHLNIINCNRLEKIILNDNIRNIACNMNAPINFKEYSDINFSLY